MEAAIAITAKHSTHQGTRRVTKISKLQRCSGHLFHLTIKEKNNFPFNFYVKQTDINCNRR
jgi:hypothetical protein